MSPAQLREGEMYDLNGWHYIYDVIRRRCCGREYPILELAPYPRYWDGDDDQPHPVYAVDLDTGRISFADPEAWDDDHIEAVGESPYNVEDLKPVPESEVRCLMCEMPQ